MKAIIYVGKMKNCKTISLFLASFIIIIKKYEIIFSIFSIRAYFLVAFLLRTCIHDSFRSEQLFFFSGKPQDNHTETSLKEKRNAA